MTQREHAGFSVTQCGAILAYLEAAGGDWVSMPTLAVVSRAYAVHSRVAELRKRGHVIEQRSERDGRRVLSYYRIANPPAVE